MTLAFNQENPILFLGIADFVKSDSYIFPVGEIDLFRLSQHKIHIVYPSVISSNEWVFLISTEFLNKCNLNKLKLRILDEKNNEIGCASNFSLLKTNGLDSGSSNPEASHNLTIPGDIEYIYFHFQIDAIVNHPGRYIIQSMYDDNTIEIGSIHFHYRKTPSFTPDQVKAIESNPNSIKAVRIKLGCKFCPTKMIVYTGLKRQPDLERKGVLWQMDLGEEFRCECGKAKHPLRYLKESMHGLLLKSFDRDVSGLSYIRRYGHNQVKQIVDKYIDLLESERLEKPFQKYIEQHPILLSRFHAKRLFVKPNIVGKFEGDFAIVDSRNQLWLIELEKPSIKLFKMDGHPTAVLMHAYGQVNDWLHQYSKYSGAILDALGLRENDVISVRGAVIAGRSSSITHEALQRHLSNPPYPNIEFMTLDDLSNSLLWISKKLA